MVFMLDFDLFSQADADRGGGFRGTLRTARRVVNRCWLDRETIEQPRLFCQNIGGCGSTYFVQLLRDNGIERVFHEKSPDLNELGVQHFEHSIPDSRLIRILRYTRHNVFFEANNRFFAMTPQLAMAFPNARFVHLYRNPADSICGSMSKPNIESYLQTSVRFQCSVGGPDWVTPFERFCHHWKNANARIHADLQAISQKTGRPYLTLRFADLIQGELESFEAFGGIKLNERVRSPVNQRKNRQEGRYPGVDQWVSEQRSMLNEICGPLEAELNRLAGASP